MQIMKHSFCSHIRSQTPTAIKWGIPRGRAGGFPFLLTDFFPRCPVRGYTKAAAPPCDSDAFVVCFWTLKKMQVINYKHCLGVSIFVKEKCDEMDICTSLIITTLLSRSTLLCGVGTVAPWLTSPRPSCFTPLVSCLLLLSAFHHIHPFPPNSTFPQTYTF